MSRHAPLAKRGFLLPEQNEEQSPWSTHTAEPPMDSTQKLVEKLVERRMQVTGESQAVATANVMAAFEKLRKDKD